MFTVAALWLAAASPASLADPAAGIVAEMNRIRAAPPAYARELEQYRARFHGRIMRQPGEPFDLITVEGVRALDEAIAALRQQPALPPLASAPALAWAAADHVRDQGPSGLEGHDARDGTTPLDRVLRRGVRPYVVGEVIAYGPRTASAVVRELIIDDGVADRGHREAIFDPSFARAGAACGAHARYGLMCVVDLAGGTDAPPIARRRRQAREATSSRRGSAMAP